MTNQAVSQTKQDGIDTDATAMLAQIVPLLTSEAASEEKLGEVARRLYIQESYKTVDFLVLEGESLSNVRHHLIARVPVEVNSAWEESVQVKASFSAFSEFDAGQDAVIYDHVKTDPRLTTNERDMASLYELGSVLVVPLVWSGKIRGALAVSSVGEDAFGQRDTRFLIAVASQVSALIWQQRLIEDLAAANKRILQLQDDTVMMLANIAEAHDEATGAHLRSMRAVAELLAMELGFSEQESTAIGQGALLHDIGKVRLDRRILLKAGPLTAGERKKIDMHPAWGEALLIDHAGFELAARIARWHHERWDGGGYPDGLREDQIPIEAAIATLADSYDAMTSVRPYKESRSIEWAIDEIQQNSGTQFNPFVVKALVQLYERGMLTVPQAKMPA
jgi:HD-GYP domain-containing protein (c-di-GMP phosphodiesterase class II)